MDKQSINRAIARISYEIIERNNGTENICIVGILRRGAVIAKRISEKISQVEGRKINTGTLDITPYRDDLKINGADDASDIQFQLADKDVVIVDDVICTGRSVRAAIDAVMSRGRPRTIQLATLIDRGHRELPIRPDYVGKNVPTANNEEVLVRVKEYDLENRVVIMEKDDLKN